MGTWGRGLPLLQTSSRDPEAVSRPHQPESSLKAQKTSVSPAIPWACCQHVKLVYDTRHVARWP